ncbi:TetR/AcrR family transcriptional regulator [Rhodospirillum sp. A1_3_36]|uniref:TetR/AcrR family transcriptional regulator n=1 Tax=Rhodospirillum sp. A1_3_36 TaxID=3391666 RepID=UPI0039A6F1E0
MPQTTPTPTSGKSSRDATRDRILDACWRLLERGPGAQVRMGDVAKEAGVSRQAVYLHFQNRADLLIATTRFIEDRADTEERLAPSRTATTGQERLESFIQAWCGFIPVIHGGAGALMAMADTDPEAQAAWGNRMEALRQGCEAAITALDRDGDLDPALTVERATDSLWALLSVRLWEQLVQDRGWSQEDYVFEIKRLSRRAFLKPSGEQG